MYSGRTRYAGPPRERDSRSESRCREALASHLSLAPSTSPLVRLTLSVPPGALHVLRPPRATRDRIGKSRGTAQAGIAAPPEKLRLRGSQRPRRAENRARHGRCTWCCSRVGLGRCAPGAHASPARSRARGGARARGWVTADRSGWRSGRAAARSGRARSGLGPATVAPAPVHPGRRLAATARRSGHHRMPASQTAGAGPRP